ncbi:hypothetical protein BC936DRAFT_138785 [Jimgerdemannia flammicorona]|uniref:Uncharacterized protein n=1 Tax=Jimgerdemannia flammicorona TaxID=994334 RepID=A0A433BJA3_9FUNG|nr:hypothetical protein BC936DRAFT_138785 [Jimgerdemannia flammicorona]
MTKVFPEFYDMVISISSTSSFAQLLINNLLSPRIVFQHPKRFSKNLSKKFVMTLFGTPTPKSFWLAIYLLEQRYQ